MVWQLSRHSAGMAYPAILGRRLDRPTLNLGFSGNGTMDLEVAALLAELDAAVYVIDCLPNMNASAVAERTEPMVRRLRSARPKAPIVLVEDRTPSPTHRCCLSIVATTPPAGLP